MVANPLDRPNLPGQLHIPPGSREEVMTALEELLRERLVPGVFKLFSRKLRLWTAVPKEEQPALFMVEHSEPGVSSPRGLPSRREFEVEFWMYAQVPPGDDEESGSTINNNLLDQFEQAISPDVSTNTLTLGGRVYRVWNEETIRKESGDLDGQAMIIYPLKIRGP